MNKPFSFSGRIRSFGAAFAGIWTMLKSQQNAWIHAFATVVVVIAGFSLKITPAEWCWIIIAIICVWMAEALNTAFEFLADVASPEFNPKVKKAKDIAAGAVLIAATGAVVLGIIVLGPYVLDLFK